MKKQFSLIGLDFFSTDCYVLNAMITVIGSFSDLQGKRLAFLGFRLLV